MKMGASMRSWNGCSCIADWWISRLRMAAAQMDRWMRMTCITPGCARFWSRPAPVV